MSSQRACLALLHSPSLRHTTHSSTSSCSLVCSPPALDMESGRFARLEFATSTLRTLSPARPWCTDGKRFRPMPSVHQPVYIGVSASPCLSENVAPYAALGPKPSLLIRLRDSGQARVEMASTELPTT